MIIYHCSDGVTDPSGDQLYGRGVTDCLGHVALVTLLLCDIARAHMNTRNADIATADVVSRVGLRAVFIANEETADVGILVVIDLVNTY